MAWVVLLSIFAIPANENDIEKKLCNYGANCLARVGDGAHTVHFFPKLSEVFMCEMTRKAGTANRARGLSELCIDLSPKCEKKVKLTSHFSIVA